MTFKLLLTVWSIRLALLLFWLVVIARLCGVGRGSVGPERGSSWRVVRAIWGAGLLLAVIHVVSVFGLVMNWSHRAAVEDTARRTEQMIGMSFGGGVYFNHAFLLIWACDAAWWYRWPDRYLRRSPRWDFLVLGYLWFIAFNATVVFETGVVRWSGALATAALVGAGIGALVRKKRRR